MDLTATSLPGPLRVRLVDKRNLAVSKYAQIKELERALEGTQGAPQAINAVPEESREEDVGQFKASYEMHKLTLVDDAGNTAYGLEIEPLGMSRIKLGAELLLTNVAISEKVLMLSPHNTRVLTRGSDSKELEQAFMKRQMAEYKGDLGVA